MLKESRSEKQGAKKQEQKINYDATTTTMTTTMTTTTTTTTTTATEEPQIEAAMPQNRKEIAPKDRKLEQERERERGGKRIVGEETTKEVALQALPGDILACSPHDFAYEAGHLASNAGFAGNPVNIGG
ncbi:hypothetical protein ALC53_07247 [Atta colombica]|uniref:Uncharacterized protein n=1 Tax=Atta colombica TaxID=520822 RepID=A0A195BDG5_9HYME|nr:hypothetical protein ALC53_07247 [Atta colombica]